MMGVRLDFGKVMDFFLKKIRASRANPHKAIQTLGSWRTAREKDPSSLRVTRANPSLRKKGAP